ncbi:hypothetical protein Lalb_Chr13g0301001 [Lupinus albus]|uniref:Uncharacterized protein n=1 Tax=Lupinus albus TaxID=3870 RepID=A0A6A4PJL0_LUPAL|nr:hypothetical protein Lalb_Chr13g0301001 [Lupinus albus]
MALAPNNCHLIRMCDTTCSVFMYQVNHISLNNVKILFYDFYNFLFKYIAHCNWIET